MNDEMPPAAGDALRADADAVDAMVAVAVDAFRTVPPPDDVPPEDLPDRELVLATLDRLKVTPPVLAIQLVREPSTIRRWLSGETKVPQLARLWMEAQLGLGSWPPVSWRAAATIRRRPARKKGGARA